MIGSLHAWSLALVPLLVHPYVTSAQKTDAPYQCRVTISIRNAGLVDALRQVGRAAGVRIEVDPRVPALADLRDPLTLDARDQPLGPLLDTMLADGLLGPALTHHPYRGGVVVAPRYDLPATRVHLTVRRVSLETAIEALMAQTGANYVYGLPVGAHGPLSLSLQRLPFEAALARLLRHAAPWGPMEYGMFESPSPGGDASPPERRLLWVVPAVTPMTYPAPGDMRLSMRAQGVEMRLILKALFRAVRANYVLDTQVSGPVTVSCRDLPFRETLQLVLRKSPVPATYRVESGVYIVVPSPAGATLTP